MKRRALLGIGGSTVAFAVTGCLDDTDPISEPDEADDVTDDGAETEEPHGDDPGESDDEADDRGDDGEEGDENGTGDRDDSEGGDDEPGTDHGDDPTVVSTEFEVVSKGGGGEGDGEARIEREGESVRVQGSIVGWNGCYTARLEEAVVENGTLVVRVEAYEDAEEGEMCTQALVVIEYEVRIELAGEVTGVRVEHDGEAVASEG
ncbi:hypothetical protein [Natronorarus salvus]|uniref:hypothetical protein n=1 Tax=Natronorarus salvus TaxID=3117733 RepID=UPI002F25F272